MNGRSKPTGLFVVVVGPDGVGKSTICSNVVAQCKESFNSTWRFHWRPGLLPKLSRTHDSTPTSANPPLRSKYIGIISLARFFYYWLDFVFGYWLVVYPKTVQSKLVVGERYFPDVLVQPERYGFAVPRWLMRFAALFVPRPDLIVLLKDDPGVIHARKPELSPAKIGALLGAYETELKHWGNVRELTTEGGATAVTERLVAMIVEARAAGRPWRAFPSTADAKVWIGGGDTLRRALNLYQPASRAGKAVKALAAACPESLASLVCRGRPDAAMGARLDRVATAMRDRLGNADLAVSISPGTAGNHRKMTAQVSGRDGVVAYGKVADAPEAARLLDNEAAMLRWLAGRGLAAAVIPEVIGLDRADNLNLLLQSPPPASSSPRPLAPDHKDAAFLTALMATDRRTVPLDALSEPWWAGDPLEPLTGDVRAALATALPTRQVVVSAGHGDYAPWNCLDLSDGRLFVFDWEYGRQGAPLLSDLFHRILMPAQLVHRTPPARLVARLLSLDADPILGSVVTSSGISRDELPGYLLIYLLEMAHCGRAQQGEVSPYIQACLRACLDTVNGADRPRNILVAAYACEPGKGSEPGVGWHVCQTIGRAHKAWVITKDNNREPIEQALAAQPNPNLHFAYVGLPRWLTFWKKGPRGVRLYYYLWQFAAWREARRLGRRVDFDLAHHVTFVNDWMFSFLALLPYPFVWGPIGSHPRIPASLVPNRRALLVDRMRCAVQFAFRLADPLFWLTAYRAHVIVGIGPEVGRKFPISLLGRGKFISHTAIGVEAEIAPTRHQEPARRGIRVLTMGRLVRIKGLHLAIRAFAQFANANSEATLLIVGRGPERDRLMDLARALGIEGQVAFRDWLPRDEALREMNRADIFLYPSFEGGGMVVLEAMAHGLPVVCLKYGGAGEMVSDDCGIRVPVGTTGDTVAGLATALETLANDKALRHRLGTAARGRVNACYLWEGREDVIRDWYAGIPLKLEIGK